MVQFIMLKGIPKIIAPDALKFLAEMGHGDEIVIADGNFPAASIAAGSRLVRADGYGAVALLEAIMALFPLDAYSTPNVMLMEVMKGDNVATPIWDEYKKILLAAEPADRVRIGQIERFAFYERAKKAYAVIATGESALYANIILKKGVI
jgi:L-fucose mutarotase